MVRLSVDEVMWCRQQSVNHQGLLCSLHCATTVVLREQLNFKSAVIRSERSSCTIQLFRQRSHKSVKVHATMPSGIMVSNSLVLLGTRFTASNKKEGEGINTRVFAVSFSNAETP